MKKVLSILFLVVVALGFCAALAPNVWAARHRFHRDDNKLPECGNKDPHIFFDYAHGAISDSGAARIAEKAAVCSKGYVLFLWGAVENEKISDEFVITWVTVAMSNIGSVHIDPMDGAYILQYGLEHGRWPDWKSDPKKDHPDIIDEIPTLKPDKDFEL